ncbi:MAG TPA: DUF4153 domain-containing protein [Candidatus Peribacterales bacterium]|nr:DUF4153 domain-containing protein [Candidatus Peribacterales bacterium]
MSLLIILFFYLLPALVLLFFLVEWRKGNSETEQIALAPSIFVVLGIAILAVNIFAYDVEIGIGRGLFLTALLFALLLSFKPSQRTPVVYSIAAVGVVSALLFGFRANEFVQSLNAAVAHGAVMALLIIRTLGEIRWKSTWILHTLWLFLLRSVRQVPLLLHSARQLQKTKHPVLMTTIKTILITILLLLFFAHLLSTADPVFNELIREIREQLFGRTALSILVALVLGLFLTFSLKTQGEKDLFSFLGFAESIVPALAMGMLFAAFLFVQQKYLFSTHSDLQSFGLTYSDYVRKGFLELLTATFFGGLVVFVLALRERALKGASHATLIRAVNVVLLLELALLLLSALKRDWMYVEMYGLTRVRIIGVIFLAWLACILILLFLFTLIKHLEESHFFAGAAILSVAVLVSLNASNMDQRIASATPPRGAPKDFFYINMLSADAIEGWRESVFSALETYESLRLRPTLTKDERKELTNAKLAMDLLRRRREALAAKESHGKWQEFNWSEHSATLRMQEEREVFSGTVDCLVREIRDYQLNYRILLTEEESERLYSYQYPFVRRDSVYYEATLEDVAQQRQLEYGEENPLPESCRR